MKDSRESYGTLSKSLHWLMAVLIGWQFLKFGDRIADGEHWVGETLVPWHVSIGTLLLALIVLRMVWAFSQRGQRPQHEDPQGRLVKIGHGLLYAAMLLLPVTGILILLGGGYGLNAFGMQLIAKGDKIAWASTIGGIHSTLAWALAVLVIGHIGMALFHQHVKGDGTLSRMV
ncbi:cytochrome b [Marinobacter nauticus]|jgi:cytochrome b561|uniref:cytochrome b n=1 Tax=Marinobacter nauticus TaxID=2743 RepID=UPI001C94E467|nr:cytochrome b [Marinobacter nauticus]MBY6220709.1 cytochrome b [Marinobacter nauticus]MCC4272305.1 cytochrome b [Marinobacter nauticus]